MSVKPSWSNIFVYNCHFQFIFRGGRKTNIYVYLLLCRTVQIEFWIFCFHTSWANQASKYAKYIYIKKTDINATEVKRQIHVYQSNQVLQIQILFVKYTFANLQNLPLLPIILCPHLPHCLQVFFADWKVLHVMVVWMIM